MPLLKANDDRHRQRLVRRVLGVRGTLAMSTILAARPDYGSEQPTSAAVDGGVMITSDSIARGLSATTELRVVGSDVTAEFELTEGDSAVFVLEVLAADGEPRRCGKGEARRLFEATNAFWRSWLAKSTYAGRWRETVNRSALTLKLLTHEPTGAIIAAPTTSLPEVLGGSRNWDYRYVWTRDAAFSLYALLHLGFTEEAAAFIGWLSKRLGDDGTHGGDELGPLRVLCDIDGKRPGRRS